MKIHDVLLHVKDYLELHHPIRMGDLESQFQKHLHRIKKFKPIVKETKMLEVGTGTGWFPILCKKNGILCEGIEICPQLIDYAFTFGRKYGVEPSIMLGNIEEADIGISQYDFILALSTFEHVEHWQKGIRRIYDALKPGGLFYFYSTNKFSLRSGEYAFPFYGWLPNTWRYRIRIARQGEDIMKLGVDFNQFNYFQLRRFFREVGFSQIFDQFEILDQEDIINPSFLKKMILKTTKKFWLLKVMGLVFSPGTLFMCIK